MKHLCDRAVLGFWRDKEARVEAAHILDSIDAVLIKETMQVTPFLNLALQEWAESILFKEHRVIYLSEGGFPEAERKRIILAPWGEQLDPNAADISILRVYPKNPRARLEHRQILGSLIGLGLKREVMGDIQAGQNGYYVAATAEITPYLLDHWLQAGSEKIDVSLNKDKLDLFTERGEEGRITVNSSRLDTIISKAFQVSRSSAQEWIIQGKVRRNGLVVSKADAEVQSGDIISCRGQGRIKLLECSQTRKEKLAWQIVLFKSHRH
jgi:Uncharacterized conserved protein, contains S4-like domain